MCEASSDASLLLMPKVCSQDGPSLHMDRQLRRTWKYEALFALLELHFYHRALLVQHLPRRDPQMLRHRPKTLLGSWWSKQRPHFSRTDCDERSSHLFRPLFHFLDWLFFIRRSHLPAKSHKKQHEYYRQTSSVGSSEADAVWTEDFAKVIKWKIWASKRYDSKKSKHLAWVYGW